LSSYYESNITGEAGKKIPLSRSSSVGGRIDKSTPPWKAAGAITDTDLSSALQMSALVYNGH
jgi:hypothetical protein